MPGGRSGSAPSPATQPDTTYNLTAAPFFVFHTPLLPIEAWTCWNENLLAPTMRRRRAGNAARATAAAADRTTLLVGLQATLNRPEVRQAIFLATPAVDHKTHALAAGDEPDADLRRTWVRHFATMSAQSTPFGLFAGCSLGRVGSVTQFRTVALAQCRSFTTLDVGFLLSVTKPLRAVASTDPRLRIRTNPTIYRVGGMLRYIRTSSAVDNLEQSYALAGIEPTDAMVTILDRAASGATLADLIETMCSLDDGIDQSEARGFIDYLMTCQLLVGGIDPAVAGPEPLVDVMARLERLHAAPMIARTCKVLATVEQSLRDLDRRGLGHAPSQYQALLPTLLTLNPSLDPARTFQVTLYKAAPDAQLSQQAAGTIAAAVQLLHRITPYSGPAPLARFCDRFIKYYGQQEVPLLEALDGEFGVGYSRNEPLPAGLSSSPAGNPRCPEEDVRTERDAHLIKRLQQTVAGGRRVLRLDGVDLQALEADAPPLPDFFAASVALAATSKADLDAGRFDVLMQGILGPSGAECLGRFCHGDHALNVAVSNWCGEQETSGMEAVPAEIVHLTHARDGNSTSRPHLRRHQVLGLGEPDTDADSARQIPVSDLTVRLVDRKPVLRSHMLGRDIVPRLATLHHPSAAEPAFYRFLYDFQQQVASTLTWQWGALSGSPFLPRVTVGRVVLCRAMWHLDARALAPLRTATTYGDDALSAAFAAVAELRRNRRIPRHAGLLGVDNTLPLDLNNILCTDLLAAEAVKSDSITLIECFPPVGRLCASSPDGHFVHNLILPFRRSASDRR